MKSFCKRLCTTLAVLTILFSYCMTASATSRLQDEQNMSIRENVQIQPRYHVIGWRFKVIDGQLYRRQYNYTTDEWIGKWELCP
mgnify:CR=1 FL=1